MDDKEIWHHPACEWECPLWLLNMCSSVERTKNKVLQRAQLPADCTAAFQLVLDFIYLTCCCLSSRLYSRHRFHPDALVLQWTKQRKSRCSCSFVLLHYILVFNTAEQRSHRKAWLIRTSTNTANYSLMPLRESQFSQRHSPVPRETDACSHHRGLNKNKWGLSKQLPINKSLSFALCLSLHIITEQKPVHLLQSYHYF